jgi:hypothetical protein
MSLGVAGSSLQPAPGTLGFHGAGLAVATSAFVMFFTKCNDLFTEIARIFAACGKKITLWSRSLCYLSNI